MNTLRQRLAALSRWHSDHGFPDPTKFPVVRQVLKGIRTLHPAQEKRARPLQLDRLQQVSDWLDRAVELAKNRDDHISCLRHTRDRALLLLGFWRGFRADEIVHLRIEHIEVMPGEGMTCYIARSKGDRQAEGRSFQCPALSRLCPVSAYEAWLTESELKAGPVFRGIRRWGKIADDGLAISSVIPLLRHIFASAGVAESGEYSSHSLRRGFAGWANANGWDLKELMEYVGWKDIKSTMRYLDVNNASLRERFEKGLPATVSASVLEPVTEATSVPTAAPAAVVRVSLTLERFSTAVRGLARAQRLIEQTCLARYAMQRLDKTGTNYELSIPCPSREILDDTVYALLDDMHRVAENNHCFLEVRIGEPSTSSSWE
ncbi:MAG: site-specific integrase [Burkholderiales bacterium]|nr:site-specific integrase [Burkholderiales bacterium]